jgi:translation initiation factor 2B subunit (eIF-2B alpha/beta/delta family)
VAHAAARRGAPVYVVADSSKLLPPGFPQRVDDDRPAGEVWPDAGPVEVWNRYFELVPTALVTRVVLEDGPVAPEALERRRRALSLPARLEEWAAGRR